MNNLEDFIKNNQSDFKEVESPSIERMWKGVQDDLKGKKEPSVFTIRKTHFFAIAASILLLIGFLSGSLWQRSNSTPTPNSLADLSPELAKKEAEFQKLIAQKEAEIGLNQLGKEAFQDIFEELELLENIHKEYQKDIPSYGQNDQLIETLIKYYEQKIRILERLSKEIEKLKYHEKRNSEKRL